MTLSDSRRYNFQKTLTICFYTRFSSSSPPNPRLTYIESRIKCSEFWLANLTVFDSTVVIGLVLPLGFYFSLWNQPLIATRHSVSLFILSAFRSLAFGSGSPLQALSLFSSLYWPAIRLLSFLAPRSTQPSACSFPISRRWTCSACRFTVYTPRVLGYRVHLCFHLSRKSPTALIFNFRPSSAPYQALMCSWVSCPWAGCSILEVWSFATPAWPSRRWGRENLPPAFGSGSWAD